MDDTSVSKSVFSWNWVIEALAASKEMNTSTLKDLINVAPVKPDVFGKNTRELVARRCLESLLDCIKGSNSDNSSGLDSKVKFDNSQSCEDVLLYILREIPLENLRIDGAELLNWDVYPFIMHKKATTVKCKLEQMKESFIVNGGHLEHVSGVKCNDLLRNGDDCTYAENMRAKESTTSLVLENRNKFEHLCSMKCSTSKRNRVDSTDEHVGYMQENQLGKNELNDFPSNAKKIKPYASSSLESNKEKPVYQHGSKVLENSSARLLISEREGFLSEKDQMSTVKGGSILEDCHGGYTPSNRCGWSRHHPACHDQAGIPCNGTMITQHRSGAEPSQHHVESVPTNAAPPDESVPEKCLGISTIIPQQTSRNEPCQNTFLETNHDTELQNQIEESLSEYEMNFQLKEFNAASPNGPHKSVDVVDPGNGADASGDSDGYHHEKIDLAAKTHEFLSFQCMTGQDLSESTEGTRQDLCMKCNVGGELLVCTTTTCPLAVHESCLGTLPKFDIKGNFFCPFCAYSTAISEYLEAKKKASLARKELTIFINKVMGHQAKEIPDLFHTKESIPSGERNHDGVHIINNGSDQLLGREDNREDHVSEHVNVVNSIQKSQQQTEPYASYDNVNSSCREKEIISNGRQQQAEPSALCDNMSCREKEVKNNGKLNALAAERERRGMVSPESSTVEGNQLGAAHVEVGDKFYRNNVSFNRSGRQKGTRQQMPEQHNTYGIENPVSACATEDEISEDESKSSVISAYSMRSRKQKMQYTLESIFQHRRKKVPWTADEEHMLREGVHKFSGATTMDRGIPWKKILEFGCHVFLNSRTTVDLKDKWRNMCKASSKSN